MVDQGDLDQVAMMALRLRRSKFIDNYFEEQAEEEKEIRTIIGKRSKKNKD